MDVEELVGRDLDGGSFDLPPFEEGEPPRRGPPRASPPGPARVAPWLLLIALGVAIERVTMITLLGEPGRVGMIVAAALFVAVPTVAGGVLAVQFARAHDQDRRRG